MTRQGPSAAKLDAAAEETRGPVRPLVLAFDSWTVGGEAHLQKLVAPLDELGFDLLLVHVGSWGHDPDRPAEERIGPLRVRDIRFYGDRSFDEILQAEKPAVALFLSTTAFTHRAMLRYCRQAGIPTLHLYHGIVRVQATTSHPLNFRTQLGLILSRAGKNLRQIWPNYARSLWKTRAGMADWLRFVGGVGLQAFGRAYASRAPPDASTTACCVYTEVDVPHAVERYRIPREAVHVVGNPDLARFSMSDADLGAALEGPSPERTILYIDTALLEAGAVFAGADDFVAHLVETRDTLRRQGFGFVVKLHPAHARTGVPERLQKTGIESWENAGLLLRLRGCAGVIVEPSSAALIPALLGLPVLLGAYGRLGRLRYGEGLKTYPRAQTLESLDDLDAQLEQLRKAPPAGVRQWIAENAGPLPASDMPRRVARVLAGLANSPSRGRPPANPTPRFP